MDAGVEANVRLSQDDYNVSGSARRENTRRSSLIARLHAETWIRNAIAYLSHCVIDLANE